VFIAIIQLNSRGKRLKDSLIRLDSGVLPDIKQFEEMSEANEKIKEYPVEYNTDAFSVTKIPNAGFCFFSSEFLDFIIKAWYEGIYLYI
jgi:hypothetical protein